MTKNEIIEHIYREHTIKTQLKKYWDEEPENREDIEQDIYVLLLQLPEDLLNEMYNNGKIVHWISATLRRQIRSRNSYYYKKYKDFKNITSTIDDFSI